MVKQWLLSHTHFQKSILLESGQLSSKWGEVKLFHKHTNKPSKCIHIHFKVTTQFYIFWILGLIVLMFWFVGLLHNCFFCSISIGASLYAKLCGTVNSWSLVKTRNFVYIFSKICIMPHVTRSLNGTLG